MHIYEIRPVRTGEDFDLISDALPFGRLWYQDAAAAVGYAKFYSRSQKAEIRRHRCKRERDQNAHVGGRVSRTVAAVGQIATKSICLVEIVLTIFMRFLAIRCASVRELFRSRF